MDILLAITGASGSIYGLRLAEELAKRQIPLGLVLSEQGAAVMQYDTGVTMDQPFASALANQYNTTVVLHDNHNLWATAASGSAGPSHMVIAPCSMGTLGRISHGVSSTLIERAADVMLKERKPLIMVPRETPLSAIHLQNMLALHQAGADILPACPGFYQKPTSFEALVDFVVSKVLDRLVIPNNLVSRWQGR